MKIAFNPSTVAALITPPNNKDITFDLRGRNIFARGVKFCGTDTWRDIKINNVSIGSNILDLRNGSNTTLTNTNGVVTINSTWRPVVDNLTSDSTTSSLSANQGRVLKSLIDGKSNSGHTHDDRYLKLTGGTMTGNIILSPNTKIIKPLASTSNYDSIVRWSVDGETKKYGREIGLHNTGGDSTGSIAIIPYKTDTEPWSGNVGLFIAKNTLKLDGKPIALKNDIPTSLKNPYSLTLQANGTTLATYDGCVSKIVNLTYDNVGAAAKNHTHNSLEPWASYITGDSHATALKSIFDKNKTSIPRNKFISMFSSTYGNGSYYMGYFLNGYENAPYGGFFVAHYDTAYYIGIANGSFTQHRLVYSTDIPNSLKNPHALTISLNGTSQGPYDGSAAKSINITPSSIGAATSGHNHDNRYLKLTGGTMQLGEGLKFHADNNYFGTNSDARIISLLDGNDKVCDGGLIIDERATLDGKEYVTELLRIRDSEFKWKGSNILHSRNSYINGNTITINGSSLTVSKSDHTHAYLPLTGGTMTGSIAFSNSSYLLWNNGSYHQRIFLTDDSTADTAVFTFQQSSDSGVNWSNLMTIRDNGKVIANTFVGALQGNASTATKLTSSAGNATLPIYFSDGKPVACTASSIFSNLSNSGNNISVTVAGQNRTLTVGYATSAGYANGIANKGLLDSQEKIDNFITANRFEYATFKTTESNNVGFASNDGIILSIPWGSTTYGAQMAFDDVTSATVKVRSKSTSWGNWYTLLHSGNYNNYAPSKTGTGASGTWGINISGNAATATSAGNADTLDGYHVDDILPYGLENLCIGAVASGGQTILNSDGSITTSGNNSDTYFFVRSTENLIAGQIYTVGFYVTGVPSGNTATWSFPFADQYNKLVINIKSNGWCWGTGTIPEDIIAGENIMFDDSVRGFYSSINISKFVIVKGKQKAYYTPPISKMSVNYANSAGNADTVDGYHANGLLTALSNSNNGVSITIGGTTKSINNISVNYANSAGNADTLDGIDSTKFLRQVVVPNNTENDFNTFSNMTLTGRVDPTTGASLKNAPWSGSGPAGGYGVLTYLFNGYNYGTQMAWEYGSNRIYIRNRHWGGSGVGTVWRTSWDTLALTSDNVASATKLQTSRLLWGQSFDGTRDISGSIRGTYFHIEDRASNPYFQFIDSSNQIGYFQLLPQNKGIAIGSTESKSLIVNPSGNVGIGTNSPAYKLHVVGDIYTTTGFKKNGSSDSYVLLGGGGHKLISDFATAGHTHDGRYLRWNGSIADISAMNWGTLTAANGYTILSHAASSDGGAMGVVNKGGQIFMQLDGYYYQREGKYRVLDTSDFTTFSNIGSQTTRITIGGVTKDLKIDADLLDGQHGSRYTGALGGLNYITINVGGDANTYYPVVISNISAIYPMQFVNISRVYNETAPNTWNTSTHKGGLTLTLLWNGSRFWDGNSSGNACYCVYKYESYSTMVGGLGNATGGKVVWLRGGGAVYHIHSMNGTSTSVTVYTSTYTDEANHSFSPKTTPEVISVRWPGMAQGADYATSASNADTATKVIVNQHTTNDTNYPLVWSNQNNSNNVTENQLYKSWSDLYYNPKNKRLTVGGSIYAAHFYESSDKTLKKNIKSILSSTNIPKIREFDWKDTEEHSYGFIAQELEEQGYDCLVSEVNGKKTVNYTATLALTVAKLQNLINIQNKKISNLTKELKALKYGRKKNS